MSTNRIIELCLVFLVSILSFSVGTFVGKKYSDNQHKLALLDPNSKTETASHETETATETVETAKEVTTTSEATADESKLKTAITSSTPITDADVAKMAEEFSDDEDTNSTESANVVKTIDEDGTVIEDTKKAVAATKTVKPAKKENLARAVATISEKAKKALTENSATAQYTIQVGAFATTAEADKVANSLQARGYKASHAEATVNGKKWHRVQVGLFNTLEDAQTYKKELVEKNHLSSAMIQRLTK